MDHTEHIREKSLMHTKLGLENLKGGDNFNHIDGIILKWIWDGVDWIRVVQIREK